MGTIIAYLRHASDRGVSLPRVGNIFDVTNPGLTTIAYLRHAARSTRPPPETNQCTASDIDSNHGIGTRPTTRNKPLHGIGTRPTARNKPLLGIGTRPTTRNKPLLGIGHCFKSRHRLLPQGQQTNHHIAMGDVVIRLFKFCCSFALFRCESQAHTAVV